MSIDIEKRKFNILKGYFNPVTYQYQYARFYFGLNVIYKEMSCNGVKSIPIPFAKRNFTFIRFKNIILPPTYEEYKIRVDQIYEKLIGQLAYFENNKILTDIIKEKLRDITYIRDGPTRQNV